MNPFPELKLFIIDDDPFCNHLYLQYLKKQNFSEIHCFQNGEECLDHLHLKPDIIFLDHNMDDMNGFEVLKKIKRTQPNIYVVMVSGQEDILVAVDALKHGAFDYLTKNGAVCEKMLATIRRIYRVQQEVEKRKSKNPFRFLKF